MRSNHNHQAQTQLTRAFSLPGFWGWAAAGQWFLRFSHNGNRLRDDGQGLAVNGSQWLLNAGIGVSLQ